MDSELRSFVQDRIARWHGGAPELSRGWVEDEIAPLPRSLKPAGRLALLAALASYQVDEQVVEAFRQNDASDRALINITGWASYMAALRIGGWLKAPDGC